jgi:hypothetical protein
MRTEQEIQKDVDSRGATQFMVMEVLLDIRELLIELSKKDEK